MNEFKTSELIVSGNKMIESTKSSDRERISFIKGMGAVTIWREEHRPYYNVYPVIAESLVKTDLSSLKHTDVKFPNNLQTLVFKFDELSKYRSFLAVKHETHLFVIIHDKTMGDDLLTLDVRNNFYDDPELKILVGALMLDDEFIERDMNEKEKRNNKPLKYFQKIGKFGWNVGANVEKEKREMGAHFRSPHLAVRWCGQGRTEKRIVRVRGTIVNRKKLTDIPTGYEELENKNAV
jgi:hypothetical protein